MKNPKPTIPAVLLVFLLLLTKVSAQDNTMYMLHQLPQANMLNPAVDFPCDFYIELPILSSTKFAYNNSTFTYKEILRQGTGSRQDSLVINYDVLGQNAKRNNYIHLELENVILGAGFHIKDYFISARIYHTFHGLLRYQKDFVGLKDGNWDSNIDRPVNFNLKGNDINEISYWGISVAASKEFKPGLRLGTRLSYLKGSSNFNTKQSDLDIITTEQPVTVDIQTNYEIDASVPLNYTRDIDGRITNIEPQFGDFVSNFIFNSNRGVSVDFGAVYEYNDKITLAASILDVGFIRWKTNGVKLTADGHINFIGEDLEQYTLPNQNTDLVQVLRDTITDSFRYNDSPNSYFSILPIKAFAGGTYQINDIFKAGLTGKIFYYKKTTIPSLTGSINVEPLRFLNLTASVSYANRSIKNIGFATIIGNKNFNFYFVSDMFPINYAQDAQSGMLLPINSRSFNFRFGFNLMFGCGNEKNSRGKGGAVCPAFDNI